jgi:Domain of unknown function (DUF4279)
VTSQATSPSWHLTAVDDNYATCAETFAALRIYSGTLDAQQIGRQLGLDATTSNRVAIEAASNTGRPAPPNLYELSTEHKVVSRDLRKHLDWLLQRLSPSRSQLLGLQQRADTKMLVHCRWWSKYGGGGPTLWPEQMELLAALKLELSLLFADYSSRVPENSADT